MPPERSIWTGMFCLKGFEFFVGNSEDVLSDFGLPPLPQVNPAAVADKTGRDQP